MEELKIIMESLAQMGQGATTAFIWWCSKEAFSYLMWPVTFTIIGVTLYKAIVRVAKIFADEA